MTIHLATDHAGLKLKNSIKDYLIGKGHDVTDHGALEYDAQDDYPDLFPLRQGSGGRPAKPRDHLGGSGQGEAMAANRIKGVRAAVYYGSEREIIRLSREHNNANVYPWEHDLFQIRKFII